MKTKGQRAGPKNVHFPLLFFFFFNVFSLFIYDLLNEFSPTLFFFFSLKCLSVWLHLPFLWLSSNFCCCCIIPPCFQPTCPATCMQQPVLPYQERVHNQPSSRREQGRLAPIPQWKQVKKLIEYDLLPGPNASSHCPFFKSILFQQNQSL